MAMFGSLALTMVVLPVATAVDSCFAKCAYPQFAPQCKAISTQDSCQVQAICKWADPATSSCCAKADGLEKICEAITNESTCETQIGCAWRSGDDGNKWASAINDAVLAGKPATPGPLDSSCKYTAISPQTRRAHQILQSDELGTVLSSWSSLYHLPSSAIDGLRALVFAESADFKSWHSAVHDDGENSQVTVVAASGRNWNGQISLAFAMGSASTTLSVDPQNFHVPYGYPPWCRWDCPAGCSDGESKKLRVSWPDECKASNIRNACPLELKGNTATTIVNMLSAAIYPPLTKESQLLEVELRNSGGLFGNATLV